MTDVKKRLLGLDILRIISMLGIIGLHVINQGGIINGSEISSLKHYVTLLLSVFFFTSVDIFGIISGYLNVGKDKNHNNRIIELIFLMLFYCLFFCIIFYTFNLFNVRNLGVKELIKSLLPFLFGRYWYLICYIFLFFMIPYINFFIKKISKNQFKKLLILLFILLSVIPNICGLADFFRINKGYSPFWLIYLYMVGGYIKLYIKYNDIKRLVLIILTCVLIGFTLNSIVINTTYYLFGQVLLDEWWINYISPFIIISSMCIVVLFTKIPNINNKVISKIINKLSTSAFSVYIIHSHVLIYDNVLKNNFSFINSMNLFLIIPSILLIIIIIYIICILIDEIRRLIFMIDKFINKIGLSLDKVL